MYSFINPRPSVEYQLIVIKFTLSSDDDYILNNSNNNTFIFSHCETKLWITKMPHHKNLKMKVYLKWYKTCGY
jgi:hypothetical protein